MDDPNGKDVPVPSGRDGVLKDGEGRHNIKRYTNGFKFRPNDQVRIKGTTSHGLRGPYTVSETHTGLKYTLEKSDGSKVDNGKKFYENELDHA